MPTTNFPSTLFAGRSDEIWQGLMLDSAWFTFLRTGEVRYMDSYIIGYDVSFDMKLEEALRWAKE